MRLKVYSRTGAIINNPQKKLQELFVNCGKFLFLHSF